MNSPKPDVDVMKLLLERVRNGGHRCVIGHGVRATVRFLTHPRMAETLELFKQDYGQQIPGPKLWREYCANPESVMAVEVHFKTANVCFIIPRACLLSLMMHDLIPFESWWVVFAEAVWGNVAIVFNGKLFSPRSDVGRDVAKALQTGIEPAVVFLVYH